MQKQTPKKDINAFSFIFVCITIQNSNQNNFRMISLEILQILCHATFWIKILTNTCINLLEKKKMPFQMFMRIKKNNNKIRQIHMKFHRIFISKICAFFRFFWICSCLSFCTVWRSVFQNIQMFGAFCLPVEMLAMQFSLFKHQSFIHHVECWCSLFSGMKWTQWNWTNRIFHHTCLSCFVFTRYLVQPTVKKIRKYTQSAHFHLFLMTWQSKQCVCTMQKISFFFQI